MVTRYDIEYTDRDGAHMEPSVDGHFVLHSDYLKLKNGLREALEIADKWNYPGHEENKDGLRLAELRKEFDL